MSLVGIVKALTPFPLVGKPLTESARVADSVPPELALTTPLDPVYVNVPASATAEIASMTKTAAEIVGAGRVVDAKIIFLPLVNRHWSRRKAFIGHHVLILC
jgi:hypothetical protein